MNVFSMWTLNICLALCILLYISVSNVFLTNLVCKHDGIEAFLIRVLASTPIRGKTICCWKTSTNLQCVLFILPNEIIDCRYFTRALLKFDTGSLGKFGCCKSAAKRKTLGTNRVNYITTSLKCFIEVVICGRIACYKDIL